MTRFDDPQFQKLKNEFYQKLEQSGFKDIEDEQGRLTDHKTAFDFSQRIAFRSDFVDLTRDYYTWATHALNWAKFESRTDEMIWILHSEGLSSREISERVVLDYSWITRKISRIRQMLQEQESNEIGKGNG